MGIYLNTGIKKFQQSLCSEIYVDKTGLIKHTNSVLDTEQRFICVSRPRRFGKTMAAQMLLAYYCKAYDSSNLFHGLTIENDITFRCHLNHYDVLFLDMQRFLSRAKSPQKLVPYLQKAVLSELKNMYSVSYTDLIFGENPDLADALETLAEKNEKNLFLLLMNGTVFSGKHVMMMQPRKNIWIF